MDYPLYLKCLNQIEAGDSSGYNNIYGVIKYADNRIKLLGDLVGVMKDNPKYNLSYTIGDDCSLNGKRPDFLTDDINNKVICYLRALCSKTRENETFTVNFAGGLISTFSCFGYRLKRQLHKLFKWHPITHVSIIDSPLNGKSYEKINWFSENVSLSSYDFSYFEKDKKVNFKYANEIEFDFLVSELMVDKFRKLARREYKC